jgi:hypothetical protein
MGHVADGGDPAGDRRERPAVKIVDLQLDAGLGASNGLKCTCASMPPGNT